MEMHGASLTFIHRMISAVNPDVCFGVLNTGTPYLDRFLKEDFIRLHVSAEHNTWDRMLEQSVINLLSPALPSASEHRYIPHFR